MWQIEQQLANNRAYFKDISVLGTFLDNHDQKRFLNVRSDLSVLRNALAFMFFTDGIPILYYGTEAAFAGGNDPNNREALWRVPTGVEPYSSQHPAGVYQYISILNNARRDFASADYLNSFHTSIHTQNDIHVFRRGNFLVAVTNVGSGGKVSGSFVSPFGKSQVLKNVMTPWERLVPASADGKVTITLENGEPKVFYF
jgi:alpha-amylase